MLLDPLLASTEPLDDSSHAAARRVDILDNAKAVLIVCVVLYHTAVVYTSADRPEAPIAFWSGFLALLKPVVMPCFCLISGHVAPTEINERRARGLCQLFATYLIFQLLYYLNLMLSFRLNGFPFRTWPVQIFHPDQQAVTWFLFALLIWRLTMPLLVRTRAPITLSLVVGLAALFLDLGVNYQNVCAFYPYFVVGKRLPRSLWRTHLSRPSLRLPFAATFLVAAAAVLLYSAYGGARFQRTFGGLAFTYACFNGAPPEQRATECATFSELLRRAAFYAGSAPLIVGFLCVLPTRRGLWTVPGYMSVYVYLLHPLILFNPFVMHGTFTLLSRLYGRETTVWSPATETSAVLLLVPCALLVCAALSTPAARCLLWPLVEPPTDRLFVRPDGASGTASPKEQPAPDSRAGPRPQN